MSDLSREEAGALLRDISRFQTGLSDPYILSWILDDAYFWSMDASLIVPDRIAGANRLMAKMGIVLPGPRASLRRADALIRAASVEELKQIAGGE